MWADKRNKKRQRTEENQDVQVERQKDYELNNYKIGSMKFEEYYRTQFGEIIKTEEEFQLFIKTLGDKLPVTFRINPGLLNYEALVSLFTDPAFVEKYWINNETNDNN